MPSQVCEYNVPTIGSEKRSKGVEEPAVAIQLFLILLLKAKQDLNGARTRWDFTCVGDKDVCSIPERQTSLRLW